MLIYSLTLKEWHICIPYTLKIFIVFLSLTTILLVYIVFKKLSVLYCLFLFYFIFIFSFVLHIYILIYFDYYACTWSCRMVHAPSLTHTHTQEHERRFAEMYILTPVVRDIIIQTHAPQRHAHWERHGYVLADMRTTKRNERYTHKHKHTEREKEIQRQRMENESKCCGDTESGEEGWVRKRNKMKEWNIYIEREKEEQSHRHRYI